jgi:hypothetical protein
MRNSQQSLGRIERSAGVRAGLCGLPLRRGRHLRPQHMMSAANDAPMTWCGTQKPSPQHNDQYSYRREVIGVDGDLPGAGRVECPPRLELLQQQAPEEVPQAKLLPSATKRRWSVAVSPIGITVRSYWGGSSRAGRGLLSQRKDTADFSRHFGGKSDRKHHDTGGCIHPHHQHSYSNSPTTNPSSHLQPLSGT